MIIQHARDRQSLSNAEHRRTHPTRPGKYRDRAKAIIECGRLKRFVGDLTGQYLDYVKFHQEGLNDRSPLAIQVPALCSPLSPPQPYLFCPPRQGDFDELIRINLSWSQFAGPVPAGWRERFLQDRRWERSVERRAKEEYSHEERKAELAALESQRSHLGVFLQMESNTPPRLQRKRPIPLPLSTPSPLVFNVSHCKVGAESKDEESSFSCQPSRRPSLHVTIPGTERCLPWLDGSVCDSPLSGINLDIPPPSVLLNASAIRAYLDSVHGPHNISSQPQSPELAHPQPPQLVCPQSPLQKLIPSKLVIEISAERMHEGDTKRHNNRKSSFATASKELSDPYTTPSPSTLPKLHIQEPPPISALKRQASQDDFVTTNGRLKKPRLAILTPATTPL